MIKVVLLILLITGITILIVRASAKKPKFESTNDNSGKFKGYRITVMRHDIPIDSRIVR